MAVKTKDIDYVIDIDTYALNEEEKTLFEEPKKKDKQAKRWFLTLNNPFWQEDFEEIDMLTNTLPLNNEYYNLDFCKSFNNIELFDFHFIKVKANVKEKQIEKVFKEIEENGEKKLVEVDVEKVVLVEKEFVVERPYFKSYEHFKQYIENLQVEGLKWSIGQVEKGHNEETVHIQFGICFDDTHAKRFYTMKKYFPTAYIAQALGSNFDIMKYCTKQDTRIEEPYQVGNISEMRSRSDIQEFNQAIKSGASNLELTENFFGLTAQYGYEKIDKIRDTLFNSKFRTQGRNVEVTYIYGEAGAGKTSWVFKKFGFENVFKVSYYGKFMFNGYNGEKVLLLDEFDGQINLQWFNNICDGYPLKLEVKGGERLACYDKVFIISNHSYLNYYKSTADNDKMFNTFYRRLNFIYRMDKEKGFISEKESEFEDIPEKDIVLPGLTRRVSRSYKYNNYGYKYIVYDAHAKHLENIQEIELKQMQVFEPVDDDPVF